MTGSATYRAVRAFESWLLVAGASLLACKYASKVLHLKADAEAEAEEEVDEEAEEGPGEGRELSNIRLNIVTWDARVFTYCSGHWLHMFHMKLAYCGENDRGITGVGVSVTQLLTARD